jgi:hypothetical protein
MNCFTKYLLLYTSHNYQDLLMRVKIGYFGIWCAKCFIFRYCIGLWCGLINRWMEHVVSSIFKSKNILFPYHRKHSMMSANSPKRGKQATFLERSFLSFLLNSNENAVFVGLPMTVKHPDSLLINYSSYSFPFVWYYWRDILTKRQNLHSNFKD